MLKVDLIIPNSIKTQKTPTYFRAQKFQRMPYPGYKRKLYWFPVWYNQKLLKEKGVRIRFLHNSNLKFNKLSNIVGVDYRIAEELIGTQYDPAKAQNEHLISFLKELKKNVDNLILFDTKDSTNIQFELLPYVDGYAKKQLLKDRSLYSKELLGNRLYTDFYIRNYELNNDLGSDKGNILYPKNKGKITLSWNLALTDYGLYNLLTPFLHVFSKKIHLNFPKPNTTNRKIILAANFDSKYKSELISFQRKQLLTILKKSYKNNPNISLGKVPKEDFLNNLRTSKAVLSPYGWGEICYRDFEAFISGAALIKPDMDHVETWPDLYKKHETYIPISWKIEDWENNFSEILKNEKLLVEVARNGQNAYKELWTKKGRDAFCERFIKIITTK